MDAAGKTSLHLRIVEVKSPEEIDVVFLKISAGPNAGREGRL